MAHPWAKTHLLTYCAFESDKWFGLWTFGRKKNTYIHTYIRTYIYTLTLYLPPRGGANFEPIDLKLGRHVFPRYVINLAKFGVDRIHGFG